MVELSLAGSLATENTLSVADPYNRVAAAVGNRSFETRRSTVADTYTIARHDHLVANKVSVGTTRGRTVKSAYNSGGAHEAAGAVDPFHGGSSKERAIRKSGVARTS